MTETKELKTHYICTGGCGGISDAPGVCQAYGCPKHGQALEPCDCTDGKHYGKQAHAHEEELDNVE